MQQGKRKRNYQMQQRIKQLRRMDKREWLIRRLTTSPAEPQFRREDLTFLFDAEQVKEVKYYSYAFEPSPRVEYIRELIEKYGAKAPTDYSRYKGFLAHVKVSPECPLSEGELDELRALGARTLPAGVPVLWGVSRDPSMDQEVSLRFVGYY